MCLLTALRKPYGYVWTHSKRFGLVVEISWSSTNEFSFKITVTENGKCLNLQQVYLVLKVPIFPLSFLHCICAGVLASTTTPHPARRCLCEGCSSPLAWSSAGGTTMTRMPVWSTVMRRPTSSSWSSMRMCSPNFRTWGRWFNSRYASKGALWALREILSSMPQLNPVCTRQLCSVLTTNCASLISPVNLSLLLQSTILLWVNLLSHSPEVLQKLVLLYCKLFTCSRVHLAHSPFFSYPLLSPRGSIKTVRQYKYIWATVFEPKEWNSWGMKCIWSVHPNSVILGLAE